MARPAKRSFELAPGLAWTELASRLWAKVQADNVFGRAAYFFLFSIFPLLIVLTSILGWICKGAEMQRELLRYFRTALPESAYELLSSTLREITETSSGGKLSNWRHGRGPTT